MKELLSLLAASAITVGLFAGCGNLSETKKNHNTNDKIKVGMITDLGTIDDKSFNQGTWEGIEKAQNEFNLKDAKYLKPAEETKADYLEEIGNLYDAGYRLIAACGYKFETTIYEAQDKYKDAKFIIIDGVPNNEDLRNPVSEVKENTVSILFSEEQSGFIAGIAASVQLKEGSLGFIGGMKLPSVQRFNWGFQQGVAYANAYLGTRIILDKENIVYQGTFNDAVAGTQIADTMYDRGVKCIFCAAGGVGNGVITSAKMQVNSGNEVWVIGVDRDQFKDGIYQEGKSVILTSAIKKVDVASYDMIKDLLNGNFKGGQILKFDISNDAVGIPDTNPNLSDDTIKVVKDIYAKLKDGSIVVKDNNNDGSLVE